MIDYLKKQGFIRAWELHGLLFAQDKEENGYFFMQDGSEINGYPKIKVNGKSKELEGINFMEEGKVLYE